MVYSIYRPWAQPRVTNYVNNNIYSGCGNRCGGGMNSTGWWIFGGGMLLSMLGGIFGGGRQQSYAPGWDYASHNRYQNPTRDKQTPDSLDLNSLKELYGDKWKIVERDGTFTAVHKETGEQKTADSYSNMLKELGGKSTSTTGQVTVNQGDPMTKELAEILIDAHGIEGKLSINDEGKLVYKDKDTDELKTCELTEQNFGAILNAIKGDVTPKNDPTGDPDAEAIKDFNEHPNLPAGASLKKNADGKYELTYTKDGKPKTKVFDTIAEAYKELGLNPKGENIRQGGGTGIKVPQGWGSVPIDATRGNTSGFSYLSTGGYNNCKDASEIFDQLIKQAETAGYKYNSPMDPNQLIEQIKKCNPSVIDKSTGKVKPNADWSKLDLPRIEWLEDNSYISRKPKSKQSAKPETNTNKLLAFSKLAGTAKYSVTISINGTAYSADSWEITATKSVKKLTDVLFEKVKKNNPNITRAEIEALVNRCNFNTPQFTNLDTN